MLFFITQDTHTISYMTLQENHEIETNFRHKK